MKLRTAVRAFIAAGLVLLGGLLGWGFKTWTLGETVEVPVVEKPMERKPDGSVTAGVTTSRTPTLPEPSLPVGAAIEHTLEVTVQPTPRVEATIPVASEPAQEKGSCEPVKLRIDWYRNLDGTVDARLYSNGEIVAAEQFSAPTVVVAKPRPWLVAATYLPGDGDVGAVVGKDILKRVFVGGMVTGLNNQDNLGVHAVIGARF